MYAARMVGVAAKAKRLRAERGIPEPTARQLDNLAAPHVPACPLSRNLWARDVTDCAVPVPKSKLYE